MTNIDDDRARREFALQVFGHMRSAGVGDVSYDAEEFAVRYDGGDGVLYLANLFTETRDRSPEEAREWLTRIVPAPVTPATPPESWEEVRPLLRPVLRPSTYALDDGGSRIRRPLFPFVDELLAIDYPDVIGFPEESKLAEWGVTTDEALTVAREENLAATVPVAELPGDGIVEIAVDEADYLSSWILVPDWLLVSTTNFEHPPVAFVPDQQSLLIVPGDPELLSEAFEAVEQAYREATRPLSPQGYTLDESGLVIPLDRVTTPNDAEVARARAVLAGAEYHTQQQWLEERYRDELEAIYVSSLMVAEREDGIHTVTVWGEGVDAALPVADFLAFATDDEQTVMVPFEIAVDLTGIVPMPGIHPPRYRTAGWPDPVVFERLTQAAVPF
ncbi:hypothetical protein ABZV91_08225 [Nocardia sp. NPDC004568]|uniref:hypothetical protein n=1 Tax=Nocardia sp. NPDC004568 TaxID=3154551 RepID=UPI0033A14465